VLSNGAVRAYLNKGQIPDGTGPKWENIGQIASGTGPQLRVRFADVDGDSLADYLIVNDDGSVSWWRNTGNLNKLASSRNFEDKRLFSASVGASWNNVVIADIDGDGRADYLILYSGGSLKAWKNNPGGTMQELGTIAPGISGVPGDKVRIKDYDGRDRIKTSVVAHC